MVTTCEAEPRAPARTGKKREAQAPASRVRVALCAAGEIWGGVEQFLLTLVPELRTASVEPVVILFHDHLLAERLRTSGAHVELLDCYGKYDPRSIAALRRLLRQHAIEVLHVHGYKATLLGGLAARGTGIAVVKTEHGRLEPPANWRSWESLWSHCRLSTNALVDRLASRHLVDAVAFVSRDSQTRARGYTAATPQQVIYNGIELPAGYDAPRADRVGGRFNIGIVGRIAKVKGHAALLAAVARLRHLDDIRLHVFGTGPLEQDCKRWCDESGLSDRVIFHGFQGRIHDHIARLDLLAIPSLDEGLPYVLLEAMSLGVPVVASRVGGLREVLAQHECGILVPSEDPPSLAAAIESLYRDRELRVRLSQRGRAALAKDFLAPHMVQRYAELYRRQLGA